MRLNELKEGYKEIGLTLEFKTGDKGKGYYINNEYITNAKELIIKDMNMRIEIYYAISDLEQVFNYILQYCNYDLSTVSNSFRILLFDKKCFSNNKNICLSQFESENMQELISLAIEWIEKHQYKGGYAWRKVLQHSEMNLLANQY